MLNTQKLEPNDDPNSIQNDSMKMHNKNGSNTDLKESPNRNRKYVFRNLFRNFFCCSCFRKNNNGHKYTPGISVSKKKAGDKNGKGCMENSDNAAISGVTANTSGDGENNSAVTNEKTIVPKNISPSSSPISNINVNDKIVRDNCMDDFQTDRPVCQHLNEAEDEHKERKCLVIDLDETLVHSSYGFVKSADIEVIVDIDGIQQRVNVCKRPYVDEFIEEMGKLFECVLFTASLGKYANPVMDHLDPSGSIFGDRRLFREACVYMEGNYVKDLDSLGRETDQTLLLDNSPVSYIQHPQHAIQITSWFDDPEDTALRDLIPYMRELANGGSSITVPAFLRDNMIPESVGIWGYPPTSLHWYLAQCHSVQLAKTMYTQQQQQYRDHNNEEDDDDECEEIELDEELDDDDIEVSLKISTEEFEEMDDSSSIHNKPIDHTSPIVTEEDSKEPEMSNESPETPNVVIEIETVDVNKDNTPEASTINMEESKSEPGASDNSSLTGKKHQQQISADSSGTHSQLHKYTAGTARHNYHSNKNHHTHNHLSSAIIKDYRRRSHAALEEAFHRPSVSSPVARPRSVLHLGNEAVDICFSTNYGDFDDDNVAISAQGDGPKPNNNDEAEQPKVDKDKL